MTPLFIWSLLLLVLKVSTRLKTMLHARKIFNRLGISTLRYNWQHLCEHLTCSDLICDTLGVERVGRSPSHSHCRQQHGLQRQDRACQWNCLSDDRSPASCWESAQVRRYPSWGWYVSVTYTIQCEPSIDQIYVADLSKMPGVKMEGFEVEQTYLKSEESSPGYTYLRR